MSIAATQNTARLMDEEATGTLSPFMKETAQEAIVKASGPWQVTLHSNYADLEKVWRKLESEGHSTLFQTYEWVSCWYDAATSFDEAEPLIMLVSDHTGEPVWILPLCKYHKNGISYISFADRGISDYAAPVISASAPADEKAIESIFKAVFRALPSSDVLHFEKLTEKVGDIPNPLLLLRGYQPFPAECHGIPLTEPWSTLKNKIMQSRLRSTVRAKGRKIKKKADITIDYNSDPETIKPVMDELMEMREERFGAIGRDEMPPMWRHFYYDLATRPTKAINASVATMKADGKTIASCFGIYRGDTYCALIPTFKMGKWSNYRPGVLLFDAMINDLSERAEKDAYFDFSVGDQNFKSRFGSESSQLYDWMMPRSLVGFPAYISWRIKIALRRHPKLFAKLKEIKQRISI